MYVSFTEDGRIGATTPYKEYASDDMIEFVFPDDFDFSSQRDYRIVNGELIHDPLPESLDIEIDELKRKLSETDYVVIKMYEATLSGTKLLSEDEARYAEIITQRQEWRDRINELEKQLNNATEEG